MQFHQPWKHREIPNKEGAAKSVGRHSASTRNCRENKDVSYIEEEWDVSWFGRRGDEAWISVKELSESVRFLYSLLFAPFTVSGTQNCRGRTQSW